MTRRQILSAACACAAGLWLTKANAAAGLNSISRERHEQAMRLAIVEGKKNPMYPFGAVIADRASGEILARGFNRTGDNPTMHGEMDCLNNYLKAHGNRNWDNLILYTTAEPCSMCMSALIWAGIGGVVYASSAKTLVRSGIDDIQISAKAVAAAAPFYKGELLGGVLEREADEMFMSRPRS